MNTKQILLDTDIGCDCDDAGALAVLHALSDIGATHILAITHTTSTKYGAACIDAINRYYGRPDIPIGVLKESGFFGSAEYDIYATKTAERFPNRFMDEEPPNAVSIARQALASQPDGFVTMLLIGQMRNTARLMKSSPDRYSPLSGLELIQKKVNKIVIMGGCFQTPPGADPRQYHLLPEYNLRCDIENARYVTNFCPVPMVFCGYELGSRVLCGGELVAHGDLQNPVRYCYQIHSNGARESWDLLAALYAVKGLQPFWNMSPRGRVIIDEQGVSRLWETTDRKDAYLIERIPPQQLQQELEKLLIAPPKCLSVGRSV